MTDEKQENIVPEEVPEAEIRKKRRFSIIWLVPLVALVIGGWLLFKAWSEMGPTITIAFETAEGLEAGKTKIKFKDVEVGRVEEIELTDDLSGVVVTANLAKGAETYLTDKTRFWVVRARVGAGEVSGLSTLFSGAYIGIEPSRKGEPLRHFQGLSTPPVVTMNMPGRHFTIVSEDLASLDMGSPVYYRQIKVGQVVGYDFDETGNHVNIKIFINAPHHKQVRKNTRFWNAGGVDVRLSAEGLKVDTQSLTAIMLGGLAFALPKYVKPEGPAPENFTFSLFEDRDSIEEKTYTLKRYYLMYFDQTVRGLVVGSPVEFRGIKVGEVVDISLELDVSNLDIRIPVLVMIEPERVAPMMTNGNLPLEAASIVQEMDEKRTLINVLVERGLRAQLKLGSIVTGKMLIDLDFHPNAPQATIEHGGRYPEFPTVPAPMEEITGSITRVLQKIEEVPFDEIGE
jgi:paraquat-inducible protein B